MKNTLKKFVALLLIVVLLVTLASALLACNDDKDDADKQARENAVTLVKDVFLNSIDENWNDDTSNDTLATLKNSGEYVVTKGWTDLVGRVLVNSSLQTPKLNLLAEYMSSGDGQKLLDDFAQNAELIISLLKNVGFTSADISSLVYGLLKEIVTSSRDTLESIGQRLDEIKNSKNVSIVAIDGLNTAIADINKAKSTYDSTFSSSDEQQLLDAIEGSRGGINQLVAFAYNMSISQITDNIFNSLFATDGALTDITDDEVRSVVSALVGNVRELKNYFTASGGVEMQRMNTALNLIIGKFDTQTYMSALFGQVVTYAKYAYMALDSIPALCDIAESAVSVIDDAFISSLREYVTNVDIYSDDVKAVNMSILLAKLWSGIAQELGESGLNDVVDKLYLAGQGDYQKATPLFAIDLVANTSALVEYTNQDGKADVVTAHPDVVGQEEYAEMLNVTLILGSAFPQFKTEYYNYVNGDRDALERAHRIAINFFGYIENPFSESYQIQPNEWYNYYVTNVTAYLNQTSADNLSLARDDLKLFVEEYFADGSSERLAMENLKDLPLLRNDASTTDINEYTLLSKSAGMYLVVVLLFEM